MVTVNDAVPDELNTELLRERCEHRQFWGDPVRAMTCLECGTVVRQRAMSLGELLKSIGQTSWMLTAPNDAELPDWFYWRGDNFLGYKVLWVGADRKAFGPFGFEQAVDEMGGSWQRILKPQ